MVITTFGRPIAVAGLLFVFALLSKPAYAVEPESIEVGITTHLGDQQIFTQGNRMSFFLSLDQKAWVYLFYHDAQLNLPQLLPNQHLKNHAYEAGMFIALPADGQAFQFPVQAPYGNEQLFAFASNRSDLRFSGRSLDNGLILLDTGIENITAKIREASQAYGQSVLQIKILPVSSH